MTSALEYIFEGYRKVPLFFLKEVMRKLYFCILIIISLTILSVRDVYAQKISDSSATLRRSSENTGFDYRVANLRKFLTRYNSPLAEYAQDFVVYADLNGLDYRLVPAITGVESTFGKFIPYNSYNAYGWANGKYTFSSWNNSIEKVSETLKTGYIQKGAPTIAKIAKRYAPPSTTWGGNVTYFISKIDTLPLNFDII